MPRPSSDEIQEAIEAAGSIRKAAATLGVDERTLRRWRDGDLIDARSSTVFLVPPPDAMHILCIDIETRPNLAHVWDLWNQNVGLNQLIESADMICWAAKWLGQPELEFRSVHHDEHRLMVQRAWTLLNDADVVMHFNGRRFDVPYLNRAFLEAGLTPPAPFKQIDLLDTVKRQFAFPSNKLAYVSKRLGLEGKVSHEGHELWIKCMAGDDEAWTRMRTYNLRDVELLEQLYIKLRPWVIRHPSFAANLGEDDICPACGSHNLKPEGYAVLSTGKYQRYSCKDCGKWSRATKRCSHTNITEVAA